MRGTVSFPFTPGEHNRIAVKVIDFRGNEVVRVVKLGAEAAEVMGRILNPLELDVEVDSEKVSDYLLRFPDMLEAVNQVIRTVREHLPEAQLELVVYHDPEIEDEYLVLYARFSQYTSAVMERIRAARRAYSPYIRDKSGWILLTTDFRQPRK
jgi:hypothetical protein